MIDPITLIELTNLKASGKLEELASHPNLGMKPEWMEELAQDGTWDVRRSLASNPAISSNPKVMKKLAADKEPVVRLALARNPSLANHPEIIKNLASDRYPDVRGSLAQNPAIPARTASRQAWQTQPATQKASNP
ncbi:hypothetical protein [Ferrimicrobium acidiphilum]|uniref:hypothetical protein n=1 Tax=Ferrimicrobium acidiphilum TaxID=121039 RepID=UPI0023F30FDD|nr:hypothetical protein [Ferrimicrobium acidiphilum]